MPSSRIDRDAVLGAIAHFISSEGDGSAQHLMDDLKLLDKAVMAHGHFPWEQIGHQFNLSRQQIYRWYFDTHQRNLYGPVSQDDMLIIKRNLQLALREGKDLDAQFQKILKEKLSQTYQRNSFTVAFNNTKRLLLSKKDFGMPESSISSEKDEMIMQSVSNDTFESVHQLPLHTSAQDDLYFNQWPETGDFFMSGYLLADL